MVDVGDVLDGKYRLVRLIGEGGMGVVYEGLHTRIGRRVAVKLLHAHLIASSELATRFLREAQAAATIGSEHIAEVTDFGETGDGAPFLVLEFLEGEDLAEILDREGPMSPERAASLAIQVCRGLAAAHARKIVHRDLKPAKSTST